MCRSCVAQRPKHDSWQDSNLEDAAEHLTSPTAEDAHRVEIASEWTSPVDIPVRLPCNEIQCPWKAIRIIVKRARLRPAFPR